LVLVADLVMALDLDEIVGRRILLGEAADDLVRRQLALRRLEGLTVHGEVDHVSPALARFCAGFLVRLHAHGLKSPGSTALWGNRFYFPIQEVILLIQYFTDDATSS